MSVWSRLPPHILARPSESSTLKRPSPLETQRRIEGCFPSRRRWRRNCQSFNPASKEGKIVSHYTRPMHTHICTHNAHTHTYTCTHTCANVYMCAHTLNVYMCAYTLNVYMYTLTCSHTYTHFHIYTLRCLCAHLQHTTCAAPTGLSGVLIRVYTVSRQRKDTVMHN